ncbi:MAG: hypothetical protein ACO3PX_17895, partial [bacterium]
MKPLSEKRANFKRLALARLKKADKAIRVIGNLANPTAYGYTEEEASNLIAVLKMAVDEVEIKFDGKKA